ALRRSAGASGHHRSRDGRGARRARHVARAGGPRFAARPKMLGRPSRRPVELPAVSPIRFVLLCLVALAVLGPDVAAAQNAKPLTGLSAECLLLIDTEGRVVFAKNAEEDHAPASLTKMMSLYLAFEDIERGKARLEDLVYISRHAVQTPRYRMGLRLGDEVPLRTVMEGVAIASANDAATALAEHLGGDEAQFVARM